MTGKRAYETAGLRDYETTGRRDCETTGRRDDGTTGRRDDETTGLRDCETTRLRDCGTTRTLKTQSFPGILSRSQAFSAVRGCARQRAIATLQNEMNFCQKGLDVVLSRKMTGWGCTWAYIPIQTDEGSAADSLLSQKLLGVRRAPSATLGKNAVDG